MSRRSRPAAADGGREATLAALGGAGALAVTILLPFHLGGAFGMALALGFLVSGAALALASTGYALGGDRSRGIRSGAALGAAGFFVSGLALLADVVARPLIMAEVLAALAVALWWAVLWRRLATAGRARWFRRFTLLAAAAGFAAAIGQTLLEPVPGAVPARFGTVLWGPWGLWFARVLRRGDA